MQAILELMSYEAKNRGPDEKTLRPCHTTA